MIPNNNVYNVYVHTICFQTIKKNIQVYKLQCIVSFIAKTFLEIIAIDGLCENRKCNILLICTGHDNK